MEPERRRRWLARARLAGLVALAGAAWKLLLRHESSIRGWSPGCTMRKLTGCYCPGCGGTRAFFALLHGDIMRSLRMNPLVLVLAAGYGIWSMSAWCGKKGPDGARQHMRVTVRAGWLMLAAFLAFGVARNLPWWPCTLLAPPE